MELGVRVCGSCFYLSDCYCHSACWSVKANLWSLKNVCVSLCVCVFVRCDDSGNPRRWIYCFTVTGEHWRFNAMLNIEPNLLHSQPIIKKLKPYFNAMWWSDIWNLQFIHFDVCAECRLLTWTWLASTWTATHSFHFDSAFCILPCQFVRSCLCSSSLSPALRRFFYNFIDLVVVHSAIIISNCINSGHFAYTSKPFSFFFVSRSPTLSTILCRHAIIVILVRYVRMNGIDAAHSLLHFY